jgi:hypothetical protein
MIEKSIVLSHDLAFPPSSPDSQQPRFPSSLSERLACKDSLGPSLRHDLQWVGDVGHNHYQIT